MGGGLLIGAVLSGCIGGDDDEEQIEEPDEYPAGVDGDGIDRQVLTETVESALGSGSFSYMGTALHRDPGGGAGQKGEGMLVARDHDTGMGYSIYGTGQTPLEHPTEALNVSMFYVEDGQGYEVEDFGSPEPVDDGEERLDALVESHFTEVLDYIDPISWGAPSWDGSEGWYAVPGTDFEGTDPRARSGSMSVDAEGNTARLSGELEYGSGTSKVEITFTPNEVIERPDWVEEAF